ncbi:hypothetical protein BDR05DRAFT_951064 [Suillus weaverae]|nr:hypothetical protein BDR05DRAFT_951064 [Suillus weaverae]
MVTHLSIGASTLQFCPVLVMGCKDLYPWTILDQHCQQPKGHLLPEQSHETGEADSVAELEEQLQLAELGCSRLEELYQKYRLRWLEESYQAGVLEEYTPSGVSTCPPHQITWDAPSPIQSNDTEVEDQECAEDI